MRFIRRTNQPLPCPAAGSDFTHDAVACKSLGPEYALDAELAAQVTKACCSGSPACPFRVYPTLTSRRRARTARYGLSLGSNWGKPLVPVGILRSLPAAMASAINSA